MNLFSILLTISNILLGWSIVRQRIIFVSFDYCGYFSPSLKYAQIEI